MKFINSKKLLLGAVVAMCICIAGWLGEEVLAEEINVAASANGGKSSFNAVTSKNMVFLKDAAYINDGDENTKVGVYNHRRKYDAIGKYEAVVTFNATPLSRVEYVTSSDCQQVKQYKAVSETYFLFYNGIWNQVGKHTAWGGKSTKTIQCPWNNVSGVKVVAYVEARDQYSGVYLLNHYTYEIRAFKFEGEIPNTPPTITSLKISRGNILWTGSDKEDGKKLEYAYRVNEGAWSSWSTKTSVAISSISKGLKKGNHKFEVKARDNILKPESERLESKPSSINFTVR